MNKITQKPELNIEYISLNKAETDSFRHSMIMKTSQLLTKDSSTNKIECDPFNQDNPDKKSIFIKKQALERTLSVYQWRHKTCYPVLKPVKLIVKSFTGNLKEKKTLCKKNSQSPFQIWNLDQNIYQLLVATEKTSYRLSDLGPLSLPQLFYLLKQILVGFECLIDIFGIFEPTENMIAVNEYNQWRFWISEDFASNSKKQSDITEAEFILKIIKMVESRLPNSKVGLKFFEEIKNLPVRSLSFLNLLDMTNIYISFNKIIASKKFVSASLKTSTSIQNSKNQSYFRGNRTFNDFKETPKSSNDNTFNKIQPISYFEHHSAKHIPGSAKLSSIKSLNQKCFSNKLALNQQMNKPIQPKKQKQAKSYMKISQFYSAEVLTVNNIEKRASFLFPSTQNDQKQKQHQVPVERQKMLFFPITPKQASFHHRTQTCHEANLNVRSNSPLNKERRFSFENVLKTEPNLSNHPKPSESQIIQLQHPRKQRKNSYYNYQKPINKEAFSESPNKSSSKKIFFEESHQQKQSPKPKKQPKRQNILMNDQAFNRSRKYSEHAPRIKSLDEFAKKNKKMFESSTMEATQVKKEIKYGNLKSKDIACHNRHATISGMAFGQNIKKPDIGSNNINNDMYNGKFEQIMRTMKSKSNEDKDENRDELKDVTPRSIKRRQTLFDIVRQIPEGRQQLQESNQICPKLKPKPQIRISNTNNLTAETLNKSELNIVKGSQQSNSLSNNNNLSNIRQSDTNSNEKNYHFNQSRRGLISQSNLSDFSCKTYQPAKQLNKKVAQAQREKQMATSQDCFNFNNHYESESSEDYLKNNQWNKKISGLFSDVASIKVMKQSSHFGDQLQFFQKDYLKHVKLEKLQKFGKQLKGSIIQYDDGRQVLNIPTRNINNKSFSLIGEVKEEPYENDPSYLEYSTSMIYQSKHPEGNKFGVSEVENFKNCESFEQLDHEHDTNNGGFNFSTELQKITQNQ